MQNLNFILDLHASKECVARNMHKNHTSYTLHIYEKVYFLHVIR